MNRNIATNSFAAKAGRITLTVLACAAVSTPAMAQLDPGDIVLRQVASAGGTQIQTGRADEETGEQSFPERVFIGEFDPVTLFTSEPGFDSDEGAFPAGSSIGFDILRGVRQWDGTDFGTVSPSTIQVRFAVLQATSPTPPFDGLVPGFSISVSSTGQWHRHLGFTLQSPGDAGVYLLELRMWSTAAAVAPSEPIWLVLNHAAAESEMIAAVQWVRENLIDAGCAADFNGDGELNSDDLADFINCFFAVPACNGADFNGDGDANGDDLADYINAFFAGGC